MGGALTRQLVDAGHDVVALARNPARARSLRDLGVDIHEGDITRKESLRSPMEGADGVFHVAGWYKVGVRDKAAGRSVNVQGTRNVLEMMEELGIAKGVYTSTLAVFSDTQGRLQDETYRYEGPHLSEYDRTKWAAHHEVAEPFVKRGLPLTIVMPGVVYGPGDAGPLRPVFRRYLQGKLRALPKGTAYCWGHVDDVAQAHVLAMDKGRAGETYIIAGPPYTLIEAFEIAERITGIPAPRRRISPGVMRFLSTLAGTFGRLAFWSENDLAETLRVGAGVTYLGRNEKAQRELGFRPRPLEEGLRETLQHEMQAPGMRPSTVRP